MMISSVVRGHVDTVLAGDVCLMVFGDRIDRLSETQGVHLTDDEIRELAALCHRYVNETLILLESCGSAAAQARAEALVEPICETGLKIFSAQSEAEAMATGLFGLICDAYIARELIARVSRHMQLTRGVPLLATDPHPEEGIVRGILGPRLATELEDVAVDLTETQRLKTALANAYLLQNPLRATIGDGGWGANCADDMARFCVRTRLRLG